VRGEMAGASGIFSFLFFWRKIHANKSKRLSFASLREECCIIISRFKKAHRRGDVGEG